MQFAIFKQGFGSKTSEAKIMKNKQVIGEKKTFYCDNHNEEYHCQKKIRYVHKYN